MENGTAAAGAKHKLRRGGSYHSSIHQYGGGGGPRQNGNAMRDSIENTVHEHSRLLGHLTHNADGEPLYNDSRPWVSYPSNFLHITWELLKSNYVNVLLVFVPLGIVAGAMGWDPTAVFILNFLAIVPLASLLSFATEEVSVRLGQTLGGLLNASFGNAVELIVSIVALKNNEIRIVQSSMLGSVLSNILLVLGCCFISGGIKEKEREFNATVASTMSTLMAVASASLIIPATLYAVVGHASSDGQVQDDILFLSRGTSIILLILYILYLVFQLYSHTDLFADDKNENGEDGEPEEEEEHILNPVAAGVALVLVTVLVAACAEFLVGSIDSIVETAHISKTFIGLILLPIVGNAAEHVTAVVVSYKGKMNLAIGVAIGSSMQIALLVTPFLVMLGWAMGREMTLRFEIFETVVFFISILIVNYSILDGKSNYLEGAMLLGLYIIIALAFYIYPDNLGSQVIALPPLS